jgi:hypothetical protein
VLRAVRVQGVSGPAAHDDRGWAGSKRDEVALFFNIYLFYLFNLIFKLRHEERGCVSMRPCSQCQRFPRPAADSAAHLACRAALALRNRRRKLAHDGRPARQRRGILNLSPQRKMLKPEWHRMQ